MPNDVPRAKPALGRVSRILQCYFGDNYSSLVRGITKNGNSGRRNAPLISGDSLRKLSRLSWGGRLLAKFRAYFCPKYFIFLVPSLLLASGLSSINSSLTTV